MYVYLWIHAHGCRCPHEQEDGLYSVEKKLQVVLESTEDGPGNCTRTSGRLMHALEYQVTSPTEFLYFYKNCGVVFGFRMLILFLLSFLWMLRKGNHYTVKFRKVSAKLSVMLGIVRPGWIFSCKLFSSIHH